MLITKFTTIFDANCRKKETVSGTRTDAEIPIELYPWHRTGTPCVYACYTRLPARPIVPVTVVTKSTNAIPIFLFVC